MPPKQAGLPVSRKHALLLSMIVEKEEIPDFFYISGVGLRKITTFAPLKNTKRAYKNRIAPGIS